MTTTVIEVGVDNPNVTMMVIENAERFGLAQLHQLRGRIGRGTKESLCVLMSETDDPKARHRLTALCSSNDGFVRGKDLKLRGPGDFSVSNSMVCLSSNCQFVRRQGFDP